MKRLCIRTVTRYAMLSASLVARVLCVLRLRTQETASRYGAQLRQPTRGVVPQLGVWAIG